MSEEKIVATITLCEQVGMDSYRDKHTSRVFSTQRSVSNILSWAESMGFKNARISDILLSSYTGESI